MSPCPPAGRLAALPPRLSRRTLLPLRPPAATLAWPSQRLHSTLSHVAFRRAHPITAPLSRSPFLPHLARPYHHSSPQAPAAHNSQPSTSGPPGASTTSKEGVVADKHHGIAYSRHELVASWHEAAREVSPLDVRWDSKDTIEANYLVLHQDGEIEQPEDKLDKQAVIEQFGLLPRDLRSLDAHILDVRPALIIAQRSLIFCSPILRAIIAHDKIVLIGTDKANPICDEEQSRQMAESVQKVMKFLEISGSATGPKSTAPFELRALEALLLLTVRGLKDISTKLQERVYSTIPQLRFGVSPAELRDLLECKRTVEDCLMGGRAMQSALADVLADDEDLAHMYISDRVTGKQRSTNDHQSAELLLEYYERRLDETSESCERLSSLLAEVDSNISLVLASTRVRLQNLELQTAIGTLALGAGATVAAAFGMNLTSGLEEHPSAFYWTSEGCVALMAGITAIGYVRLMRARRSQLFLRSALRPRADEDLTPHWRAGPVSGTPTSGSVEAAGGQKAVEAPAAKEEGPKQEGEGEKKAEVDGAEEVEEPMKKKDGTQL